MPETVTVDTAQGKLRGKKTTSSAGGIYYSFQGVPYAEPPLGPLRFKPPQPPSSWTGVRDALQERDKCTQQVFMTGAYEGGEDCLYLNYTPELPKGGPLLPVIFSIHGGGFTGGTGNVELYGPDYYVKEGVVIVSLNCRVGILGFLCLDGPASPGNMGLKDQVAALRWTQQNIAKFGGDPNNVTITGISAGGASVHYLLLSPMCKGLFHRAASSSGAVLCPWAITRRPRDMAFKVGAALGCKAQTAEELVEFFRNVDHLQLVKAAQEHGALDQDKERIFPFWFTPTLEVEVAGIERFLPAHPLQLLEEGRFHAVPTITGITSEEAFMLISMLQLRNPEVQDKLNRNFDEGIIPNLRLPKNCSNTQEIMSKIKHYFMGDKPLSNDTIPGFIHLLSDIIFNEGDITTVKLMAKHAKAPVYQYCFSFEAKLKLIFPFGVTRWMPGVPHAADMMYMFTSTVFDGTMEPGSPEAITRERFFKIYTNFAKTGNPTPAKSDLLPVIWEPHTANNPCYLEINEELSMKKNLFGERMAFWEELYKSVRSFV